jgi:membrane protein
MSRSRSILRVGLRSGVSAHVFACFRLPISWRELVRRTIADALEDDCSGLAAQLAFYFFLAVFPALLFLVSLLAFAPLGETLADAVTRLEAILPAEVVTLIREQVEQAATGSHGGLLTIGIAGAVWSSSSAVTAIITALNRAYDLEEWRPWWKRRLLAILLTIAFAVFVVLAFVFVVGGADLAGWLASLTGAGETFTRIWSVLQWPIAFALVVFAVDLVYYFAPNIDAEWVWVTPGALLATVLWLVASLGFKLYVQGFGSYSAVNGAIGTVIVLMLWLYLSGFALLIGAELNAEIDKALSPRPQTQGPAPKVVGPAENAPL